MARPCRAVLPLVTCGILWCAPAHAQWSPDPNVNNAVSVGTDDQSPAIAVTDGSGGTIVVWRNLRFDSGTFTFFPDLLAQRLSATGATLWAAGGVTLVTDTVSVQATQLLPPFAVVADGTGGSIVAWRDTRNDTGDIFAQRINAAGAPQWTAGGVPIVSAALLQARPMLVADGSGGAIIAWQDRRGLDADIYAQRVTAAGTVAWTANGVPVCTAVGDQLLPALVSDGAAGAILAWTDARGTDLDIYAQRVVAAGTAMWTANGVLLASATGLQTRPSVTTDGAAGAIVAWEDGRNSADNDIYARLVTAAGAPQWTANGVQVANTANATFPIAIADGAGGVLIAWTDERGPDTNVFAQRLNAAGAAQWAANGVTVCGATGGQFFPVAVADGAGGIVIGWEDNRTPTTDVFAQRLNASGAGLWTADGRPVSTPAGSQAGVTIAPDGSGGGLFAWSDGRPGALGLDVYAAHVDGSGVLPVTLERFTIE